MWTVGERNRPEFASLIRARASKIRDSPTDAMDRRRHRARHEPPRRGERHPRADDARARPPSRSGARRRGSRLRPVLQPGNQRQRDLAGAARRASRQLHGRGAELRAASSWRVARALRHHASRGAVPAPAGARSARGVYEALDAILDASRRSRACGRRWSRASNLQMLAELGFGLDLDAAPRPARPRSSSMCRRNRAARCRASAGEPWQRQAAAAAGVPRDDGRTVSRSATTICATASRSPDSFSRAMCSSRAALALPDARERLHRRGRCARRRSG